MTWKTLGGCVLVSAVIWLLMIGGILQLAARWR